MVRFSLFIFLLVISFKSSALVPASAYLLGGGPEVAAPGAAVASGAAVPFAVGAGAFGVGMAAGYFLFDDLMGHFTRLPTADEGPNGEHAVPAPSAPSTSQPTSVPIWTIGPTAFYKSYKSDIDVCSMAGGYLASGRCYISASSCTAAGYSGCYDNIGIFVGGGTETSCPSGYIAGGSGCVLDNPREATPDNNCDMKRVNGVYTNLSDPDCQSGNPEIAACMAMANCSLRFLDADGYPVAMDIRPTPNGGTSVDYYEQQPTKPDGTTPVQHTHVGIDPAASPSTPPKVGEVSGGTGTGSVPADQTQPVTSNPDQGSITFPSDYARVGEAAQAADKVVTGLKPSIDKIHDDLTKTENLADPSLPTIDDMPKWGNTFDGLLGWRLPAHASECPKPVFDFQNILGAGKVFTMTSHCDIMDSKANVIFNSMMVFWSLTSLFIVLRA